MVWSFIFTYTALRRCWPATVAASLASLNVVRQLYVELCIVSSLLKVLVISHIIFITK